MRLGGKSFHGLAQNSFAEKGVIVSQGRPGVNPKSVPNYQLVATMAGGCGFPQLQRCANYCSFPSRYPIATHIPAVFRGAGGIEQG
jgi:hypothetical protein